MYLKKIEIHGFKSFANKIKLEFHDGITGIVGPNGSGKSNVADAVRWVLGEQRAKQLRGASMQDVIFAGTQMRKPLSYAYVSITLDNSDGSLSIDYDEVTVTRRVYRSGESEYMINGSLCRLKDINELFYDTGIGKEGYSIIGQGQIEKILNGKPEERRELFDEAAGIVKFKQRKNTAQKKLENERDNLSRVMDILLEQERQIEPLKEQAQAARIYLQKKEELKKLDVNMFLLEIEDIEKQIKENEENISILKDEYDSLSQESEKTKSEYEKMQQGAQKLEEDIEALRIRLEETISHKAKMDNTRSILETEVKSLTSSEKQYEDRILEIENKIKEKEEDKEEYNKEEQEALVELGKTKEESKEAKKELANIQGEIDRINDLIDKGNEQIINILDNNAAIKANQQRYDTMIEQLAIRKTEIESGIDTIKDDSQSLEKKLEDSENALEGYKKELEEKNNELLKTQDIRASQRQEMTQLNEKLEKLLAKHHKENSRLEALRNIAERYEGYGNAVRKVMEEKDEIGGICGVVADLIKVDKKYETAIETALGGSIQNIVTEDEGAAKSAISFLKKNKYGRATFLPLTSVGKGSQGKFDEAVLDEEGVIGTAASLVQTQPRYSNIVRHLLGRTIVATDADLATAIAKKYSYRLYIVTLEGENLRPGGSISGGAYKNTGNLLGRNSEMSRLKASVEETDELYKKSLSHMEDLKVARDLLKEDIARLKDEVHEIEINLNNAKLSNEQLKKEAQDSRAESERMKQEQLDIADKVKELEIEKTNIAKEALESDSKRQQLEQDNEKLSIQIESMGEELEKRQAAVSQMALKEAKVLQAINYTKENIARCEEEIKELEDEKNAANNNISSSADEIENKNKQITKLIEDIKQANEDEHTFKEQLEDKTQRRDKLSSDHKEFFEKREEISSRIGVLDKELFRLDSRKEKLEETMESRTNYMWGEYELTLHLAKELKDENMNDLAQMKRSAADVKGQIKDLGNVNVNAIEDYKQLSERYEFLSAQRDDLVESEKNLVQIIDDLDRGMRKQFSQKFKEIQMEFDKAFKNLFGGGKGTLELETDEGRDLLECGIAITAQPPGKKLQNMMQLSGGEKALTAIALLFAIQNLKPSPFCLLDEIEAALDDSNVTRFAQYVKKLTKHTQFILITHRRGTMTAADRLYGITMQEKGVSTLVSVNLIESNLDD